MSTFLRTSFLALLPLSLLAGCGSPGGEPPADAPDPVVKHFFPTPGRTGMLVAGDYAGLSSFRVAPAPAGMEMDHIDLLGLKPDTDGTETTLEIIDMGAALDPGDYSSPPMAVARGIMTTPGPDAQIGTTPLYAVPVEEEVLDALLAAFDAVGSFVDIDFRIRAPMPADSLFDGLALAPPALPPMPSLRIVYRGIGTTPLTVADPTLRTAEMPCIEGWGQCAWDNPGDPDAISACLRSSVCPDGLPLPGNGGFR